MSRTAPFRHFIRAFTEFVGAAGGDEKRVFTEGKALLADLIRHDDWLPDDFARPHPERYQQYLLHCDPLERFSVVSFVWGPGQHTPVHDHLMWGMIGVLRGAEQCEEFDERAAPTGKHLLEEGGIDLVSPRIGDIHRVSNALADRPSISIHVYGGNIGTVRRHVYEPGGAKRLFVSGYSSALLPNIWGVNPD